MALYIKVNTKVAQHLHLENDRNYLKDGNFLLWQNDMLAFGKLIDLPLILEQIGGIALRAHEAREEQDGKVLRPLPEPTDPRFIIEKPADDPQVDAAAPEADGETQPEAGTTPTPEEPKNDGGEPAPEPEPEPKPAAPAAPAAPAEEKPKKTTKK